MTPRLKDPLTWRYVHITFLDDEDETLVDYKVVYVGDTYLRLNEVSIIRGEEVEQPSIVVPWTALRMLREIPRARA